MSRDDLRNDFAAHGNTARATMCLLIIDMINEFTFPEAHHMFSEVLSVAEQLAAIEPPLLDWWLLLTDGFKKGRLVVEKEALLSLPLYHGDTSRGGDQDGRHCRLWECFLLIRILNGHDL
jgi:hypothetical protein